MHEYDFRLRFNLAETYRIDSDSADLDLLTLQTGELIELRSGGIGSPIKEHNRVAILGKSFVSREEAGAAAEKCKRVLLYWAVQQRVGIDFGDGRQRSTMTKAGLKWMEEKCGHPCRNDIHGIDVYEHKEDIRFVRTNMKAILGKSPHNLITIFQREFLNSRQLTEKQVLASEIYASSFFDISARSRFITLVTAVEALTEQRKYSANLQGLVDELVRIANQTTIDDIDETSKNSVISRLGDLRSQSITQAAGKLVGNLLPEKTFGGKSAIDFFKFCYNIRSRLLHDGKIVDKSIHILELANRIEAFVHQLILASLNNAPKQGSTHL
jgi:hypothetical protein